MKRATRHSAERLGWNDEKCDAAHDQQGAHDTERTVFLSAQHFFFQAKCKKLETTKKLEKNDKLDLRLWSDYSD